MEHMDMIHKVLVIQRVLNDEKGLIDKLLKEKIVNGIKKGSRYFISRHNVPKREINRTVKRMLGI